MSFFCLEDCQHLRLVRTVLNAPMDPTLANAADDKTSPHILVSARPRPEALVRGQKADEPWAHYMPIIRRLYFDERKSLKQVREIMEKEHGFTAS